MSLFSRSESYRCGVFFAGRRLNAKPREKIFILPRFNATCPAEEPGLLGDECVGLVSEKSASGPSSKTTRTAVPMILKLERLFFLI